MNWNDLLWITVLGILILTLFTNFFDGRSDWFDLWKHPCFWIHCPLFLRSGVTRSSLSMNKNTHTKKELINHVKEVKRKFDSLNAKRLKKFPSNEVGYLWHRVKTELDILHYYLETRIWLFLKHVHTVPTNEIHSRSSLSNRRLHRQDPVGDWKGIFDPTLVDLHTSPNCRRPHPDHSLAQGTIARPRDYLQVHRHHQHTTTNSVR